MKRLLHTAYILILTSYLISSCTHIDLYEKTVTIPGHAWKNSYQPAFTFTIKDTTAAYQLYFIIRHTDKYNYNNIYINLHAKQPGTDSAQKVRYDLRLGSNEAGWLGTGMDDIYEHRILLTPSGQSFILGNLAIILLPSNR